MKKLKRTVLCVLLAMLSLALHAQEHTVSGTVYDVDGTPMPGVSVVVTGTTNGVITDASGNFSIRAASGAVLQFWYLGYETIEETVDGSGKQIEVHMQMSADVLDDVVVVGYGAVKKSDLTGSVGSVKMEAIADLSATSVYLSKTSLASII